jgi:uncharacterized protein (TIGR00251 family)
LIRQRRASHKPARGQNRRKNQFIWPLPPEAAVGLSSKRATAWVSASAEDGALVRVHVVPGAREGAIAGVDPWRAALLVKVEAPPLEGAANEELCARLARALAVPKANVSVRMGAKSRDKTVEVRGLSQEAVREKLGGRK